MEELGLPAGKVMGRGADELVRDVAVVLRELVAGMMGLLASRSAFKSQFRIEGTMIRPVENNPLKFAADARQALEHLFFPSGKAYLPAERAVREAVQNLEDHKVALLAALRSALESLVARFDPEQLEARFGERGKSSLLSGKGRQWEMYRELFAELRRDPDALFADILGEGFAKAYEEQLEQINRSRR
jgi:type VI secretion system FHA domain protein